MIIAKGRDNFGSKEVLKDFKGMLQTDAYRTYDQLFAKNPNILLVFSMAHARRKFVEAQSDN